MNTKKATMPVMGLKGLQKLPLTRALVSLIAAGALSLPLAASGAAEGLTPNANLTAQVERVEQLFKKGDHNDYVRIIVRVYGDDYAVMDSRGGVGLSVAQAQADLISLLSETSVGFAHAYTTLPFVAMTVTRDELATIVQSPLVQSIEVDELSEPFLADSTKLIGADKAWEAGFRGTGTNIAIIDSGMQVSNSFFGGRVVQEACFSSNIPASNIYSLCADGQAEQIGAGSSAACADNSCAHGTWVAGIAAGSNNNLSGVAPAASITSIQVFTRIEDEAICGSEESCLRSFTSDQLKALEYLYENHEDLKTTVVNMSLGGGNNPSPTQCDTTFSARKEAVDLLRGSGVATVAAAGNDGYFDALAAPACISSVISVGSTLAKDTNNAECTNGETKDSISCFSNSASFLDLLAPGHAISTANVGSGLVSVSGTSMAAPHVAGCIALMREASPAASVNMMVSALKSSGTNITDPRNNVATPRLNCKAAIDTLLADVKLPATTGLVLVSKGGSSATLSWNAVSGATSYLIDVSTASNFSPYYGDYNRYDTESASASYTITGLHPDTRYYVRVRAYGGSSETTGNASNIVDLTTEEVISIGEAVNNESLDWFTYGDGDFFGALRSGAKGGAAARSPALTAGQDAWFSTAVVGPGQLSFDWQIESTDLDAYIEFRINGERYIYSTGNTQATFVRDLGAGAHTLEWRLNKPLRTSNSGVVWIDNVSWTGTEASETLYLEVVGEGSVTSSPAGLECTTRNCVSAFAPSTVVTLTAVPADGKELGAWSGACTGQGTCTVTMDEAKSVKATFRDETIRVSTNAGPGGKFDPEFRDIEPGSSTTFKVVPNTGYNIDTVAGCDGELSGSTFTTGEVDEACTVTATFKLKSYTLSAIAGEGGTVSPETVKANHGSQVTFTLTPSSGWQVRSVSGCPGELLGNVFTTDPLTGACTVIASFEVERYSVSFDLGSHGIYVSGDLEQSVARGSNAVAPTIIVRPGYELTGWSPSLLNITSDVTISAQYANVDPAADDSVTVTVNVRNGGTTTAPSSQVVSWGSQISFDVTPDSGYKQSNFIGGSCPVGEWSGLTYTTGHLIEDCTLTVNFSRESRQSSVILRIIAADVIK